MERQVQPRATPARSSGQAVSAPALESVQSVSQIQLNLAVIQNFSLFAAQSRIMNRAKLSANRGIHQFLRLFQSRNQLVQTLSQMHEIAHEAAARESKRSDRKAGQKKLQLLYDEVDEIREFDPEAGIYNQLNSDVCFHLSRAEIQQPIQMNASGTRILFTDKDGAVQQFSIEDLSLKPLNTNGETKFPPAMDAQGTRALFESGNNLYVYYLAKEKKDLLLEPANEVYLSRFALSATGHRVVHATERVIDSQGRIASALTSINLDKDQKVKLSRKLSGNVHSLLLSPDGTQIAFQLESHTNTMSWFRGETLKEDTEFSSFTLSTEDEEVIGISDDGDVLVYRKSLSSKEKDHWEIHLEWLQQDDQRAPLKTLLMRNPYPWVNPGMTCLYFLQEANEKDHYFLMRFDILRDQIAQINTVPVKIESKDPQNIAVSPDARIVVIESQDGSSRLVNFGCKTEKIKCDMSTNTQRAIERSIDTLQDIIGDIRGFLVTSRILAEEAEKAFESRSERLSTSMQNIQSGLEELESAYHTLDEGKEVLSPESADSLALALAESIQLNPNTAFDAQAKLDPELAHDLLS